MWIYYVIAGIFGGIVGGMGMGGGTLLIPILTIFLGFSQHLSQGVNLMVFLPLSFVAIIIHAKNKLIDFRAFFYIIFPAILSSLLFSYLSNGLNSNTLKLVFAIFLIVLGVLLLLLVIIKTPKKLTKRLGI